MQSMYLFLVLAVAAVSSEVIDLNNATDTGLAKANELLRQRGITYAIIPAGQYGNKVSFSDSLVVGLDSLERTGDNTLTIVGNNATFDFHYGFGLLQQTFKTLKVNGQVMSAGYRVRDNSIHFAFTVHNETRCYVTLEDLGYERLAKVDFFSSRTEYDAVDVEDVFEQQVLPYVNKKVNKYQVQRALQTVCRKQPQEILEAMPFVHLAVTNSIRNVF